MHKEVAKVSKAEVRRALRRMKSGKAAGSDDVTVGVWKCLGEVPVEFLTVLSTRSQRVRGCLRNGEVCWCRFSRTRMTTRRAVATTEE